MNTLNPQCQVALCWYKMDSLDCEAGSVLQTLFSVPWPLRGVALLAHGLQQHPAEGLHHRMRLAHLNLQIMSIAAVGCRQTQEGDGGRRGVSLWLGKSNKHKGLHPMLALRQSHIMTIQSHLFSPPFFFIKPPAFSDSRCLESAAILVIACNYGSLHGIQISYELLSAAGRVKWMGLASVASERDQRKCICSENIASL